MNVADVRFLACYLEGLLLPFHPFGVQETTQALHAWRLTNSRYSLSRWTM